MIRRENWKQGEGRESYILDRSFINNALVPVVQELAVPKDTYRTVVIVLTTAPRRRGRCRCHSKSIVIIVRLRLPFPTLFPFLAPFSAARFHFKAGHERLSPSARSNNDDDIVALQAGTLEMPRSSLF
jgi:hypothetical protein